MSDAMLLWCVRAFVCAMLIAAVVASVWAIGAFVVWDVGWMNGYIQSWAEARLLLVLYIGFCAVLASVKLEPWEESNG